MEVIVSINNLEFAYPDRDNLFNNLCIYIEKNRITGISGSNNCGKTTLFRILGEQRMEQKNTIIIDGKDITEIERKEYKEMIQTVFSNEPLVSKETILDYLYLQMDEVNMEKIESLIEQFGLKKVEKKEISKCSSEEKMKVQIISAILKAKKMVLIDGLDIIFGKKELKTIYSILRKCIKKYDLTFVTTTHTLEELILTDDTYIINDGIVILHGKPLEVLSNDNILNKAGLQLPFMIDLSVKLKDYDLIHKIELDKERLINTLWK
jgi:ABC-type multidrug transport system ATPase subunit